VIALGVILAVVTAPALVVFFIAYRRVRGSLELGAGLSPGVPVATVVAGGPRFTEGRIAQRIARRVPAIQAGLVAFAMAAITFMVVSMAAMVVIAFAVRC
jgi:hypothetical protein